MVTPSGGAGKNASSAAKGANKATSSGVTK